MPTPRLHGYDFSYQGLIGIWEGFQPSSQELSTPAPTPRSGLSELPPSTPGSIAAALGGYSKRRALSPSDEIHGDYHAAILVLCSRKGIERPAWKPLVSTQKTEQRQFALHLCGWSLKDEDLHGAIKKYVDPCLWSTSQLNQVSFSQVGERGQAFTCCMLVSVYEALQ